MADEDTIFALSSGLPPSAIAIVRVSGPRAAASLQQLTGRLPKPRLATRSTLRGADGNSIDDALVLWFPGPASATGEDVAEFHVHGSRAVIRKVCGELGAISSLRPAKAGEFTRRAFENGTIDLTQAEAIDDLIHSDTDAQRRQALRQLDGMLGERVRTWRRSIIDAGALIEAGIDFSDEDDVPDTMDAAKDAIERLSSAIAAVLDRPGAERLRDGLVVAIAGATNVGKSTLVNRLAGREIAIVSPYAGTTRDPIEAACDFGGYPVTLIDTAGLRESADPVEQEGIRRARDRADTADLRIWLMDANCAPALPDVAGETWIVQNKSDLGSPAVVPNRAFSISALTGDGLEALTEALADLAASRLGVESAVIFRERHRKLLQNARSSLNQAIQQTSPELVAEHLRSASGSLGQLLGRVHIEDVLDAIFRDFCIGK